MDYQGNAKKDKVDKVLPEKKIEKVISGEVKLQKKSLGRKIKDTFIEADFKSVSRYVVVDVLFPALRNMIVDASQKGIERMVYGERVMRQRNFGMGPRITYNNPIDRGYRNASPLRNAPPVTADPRSLRQSQGDFILSSREEGEQVIERLNDIIDNYEVASVADLNELVGFPSSHVDNKWGWTFLGDVQVRQVRDGYMLVLPAVEPIQ